MHPTFLSAISNGSKSGILRPAINWLCVTARLLIVIVGLLYSQAAFAQSGAKAWGRNDAGQLGNGTFTNSTTPVTVTGLDGLSSLSAGGSHNLALMSDGTVRAWGMNNSGQLGNGTTINSATPVNVSGLSGVVAIAAGNTHNLALLADGTVKAWGNNTAGQLGDGTTTNRTTPVAVSGLSGVVAIAGGDLHSLALLSDGTVKAWGYNLYGQLGDATTTNRTTPVAVNGISGATSIATGAFHSLALLSNGAVKAWGRGDVGQLGNGANANKTTPVAVSGLSGVVSIAAGDVHSLALLSNGTVWGWGWNFFGQLGDGTITDTTVPVAASGISGATAIAAGLAHTLARLNDGTVKAWGYNVSGQLGDGTIIARTTPVTVSGLNGAATVTAGNFHSLALTSTAPTDLFITKSDSPDPVLVGDNVTYTIIVTNNGPNPAPSTLVTDVLPGGLTFVSSSTSQGSCAGTSNVTCNLGTVASWASATITIVAGAAASGAITNTATVTSAAPDPNTANNAATTATTVNADITKPVIVPTVTPQPYLNGWNNTNVTVNWSVSDPESGIASSSGCAATVLTTETSATTLTCSATNGSGLSHFVSVSIKIDKAAPSINFGAATPPPNASGWNNSDVVMPFTATDGLSGLDTTSAASPMTESAEGSSVSGTVTATDKAGNSATAASPAIKIDKTPPNISSNRSPAPNSQGWNNTDVTVGFTLDDPVSGIASASPGCAGAILSSETGGTTLMCSATNAAGLAAAVPIAVRIDKTKPVVSNVVVNPNPAPLNTGLTLTANVDGASPGASPIISVEFNMDDGPFSSIPVSGQTSYAITAAIPPFATPALHNLCVRSADAAGNVSDLSCVLFAIYGANAGFVSGAGWIQSPLGAYAANPSLSGKAHFGFVSKYLPGAHIPSGETHFQFKTGDLKFDSTSYDWLVVAGARCQFKGSGTINGSGDYMFLLTAIDGQRPGGRGTDRFRIKIIDKNGSSVVYDNQMGKGENGDDATELGAGSIVIRN